MPRTITTISLSPQNKRWLYGLAHHKDETYDDILTRLREKYPDG